MRGLGLLAILLWGGCNVIFPFDVRTADDGSVTTDADGGVAAGMDDPGTGNDGDPGGIYCFDAAKQMTTVFDVKARALDVDTLGGFVTQGAKGALYVTRWGGYYVYPGGAELTDPAFPGVNDNPGHSGSELRFARGGPHAAVVALARESDRLRSAGPRPCGRSACIGRPRTAGMRAAARARSTLVPAGSMCAIRRLALATPLRPNPASRDPSNRSRPLRRRPLHRRLRL